MHYFCKLHAPRPTFAQDMTEEEVRAMVDHQAYWRDAMTRGNMIAFGMVADPNGPYGVGIVEFESEDAVRAFTHAGPTIRAGLGFSFEVQPMPRGVVVR